MVGVSLDDDLEELAAAVAEHDVPWPQVCDGEVMDSEPVELYRVQGIPAFVLIDDEGRIVERFNWIDYPPDADFLDLIEERLEELLVH